MSASVHHAIDRFVEVTAASGVLFQPLEHAPWIDALEARLSWRLPPSFRSLVTRYAFLPFEAGPLELWGNMGSNAEDELSVAIFADKALAKVLLKGGCIPFARPESGDYDRICFDARPPAHNREHPIVRIDHESVLCYREISVTERIAPSFLHFVQMIE